MAEVPIFIRQTTIGSRLTLIVDALSIVSPSVQHIVDGKKGVEIRRWLPPEIPFLDLVLVENAIYLSEEKHEDRMGWHMQFVDITGIHEWTRAKAESQGVESLILLLFVNDDLSAIHQ